MCTITSTVDCLLPRPDELTTITVYRQSLICGYTIVIPLAHMGSNKEAPNNEPHLFVKGNPHKSPPSDKEQNQVQTTVYKAFNVKQLIEFPANTLYKAIINSHIPMIS